MLPKLTAAAVTIAALVLMMACDDVEEEVPAESETPSASATAAPSSPSPVADQTGDAGTPTPAACPKASEGEIFWRWDRITFVTPDRLTPDAGKDQILVIRRSAGPDLIPPDGGLIVFLRTGTFEAWVDAHLGQVLKRYPDGVNDARIEAILDTVCVDPVEKSELPWPYAANEPAQAKEDSPVLMFWRPAPDSGLVVNRGCRGPGGPGDTSNGGCFLVLSNGVSAIAVEEATGEVIPSLGNVQDEDKEAFDRWVDSIERAP